MNPAPAVVGVTELAQRWGITRQAADAVVRRLGFPGGTVLARGSVWSIPDVEEWERCELAAGRPLPGQRPRGREPKGGR